MKKTARKIDVRGMSVNDILNIPYEEWNSLSTTDLRALTTRLNSVANKRLKRLESSKEGKYSPALQTRREGRKKDGDVKKFSSKLKKGLAKDAEAGKIKSAFADVKNFLSSKTSTAKGAQEFKEKLLDRFPELTNKDGKISEYKMSRVWKAYHGVAEMNGVSGALGQVLNSTEFQNAIAQAVKDKTYRKLGMTLLEFSSHVFDVMARNPNRSREEVFRMVEDGRKTKDEKAEEGRSFEVEGDLPF